MAERHEPGMRREGLAEENIQQKILEIAGREPGLSIREIMSKRPESIGAPSHRVARNIYGLISEGRIIVEDPDPPLGVIDYVKSTYGAWFIGATFMILLTFSLVYVLPQTMPFVFMRYITGAVFVLYLPGYALIEALYPKKEDLEALERLALSIGLSLALVPLVGLGLNYTPWGIRLTPIFITLAAITSGLSLLAAHRKVGYLKLSQGTKNNLIPK